MISLQDLLVREFQGKVFKGTSQHSAADMPCIGEKIEWVTLQSFPDGILPLCFGMQSGATLYFDYDEKISVE